MRAGWLLLSVVAMSTISTVSSASPTSDAFAQGSAMGNGSLNNTFSGINPTTAQTTIPSYGASVSTQSGYFAGGNGNIESPGSAQISDCSNAPPSSDPMANQYCNAVNFLATNPGVRPQLSISSNDPLIANSRAISNNPSSILQSNGISTTGTTSQCVPVTTTTPAQYTTQMCSTVQGMNLAQCVLGRVVNIADNTNYQCNLTVNSYQTQTCSRTVVVTVVPGPTVPATTVTTGYEMTYEWPDVYLIGTIVSSLSGFTRYPPWDWVCATWGGALSYTNPKYPNYHGEQGICMLAMTSSSCPSGYTLSGSYCVGPATVTTTWNDGCSTLEAAAQ